MASSCVVDTSRDLQLKFYPTSATCKICSKVFKNDCSHLKHVRKKHGNVIATDLYCFICRKAFTDLQNLDIHMRQHNRNNDLKCKSCADAFVDVHSYVLHIVRVHCKVGSCVKCKNSFKTKLHVRKHLLNMECENFKEELSGNTRSEIKSTLSTKLPCSHCHREFSCAGNLKQHIRSVHEGFKRQPPRQLTCDLCDLLCASKSILKAHMRTHTGQQPFVCPYCKRTFTMKGNLNVHVRRWHTGPSKYKVNVETYNKQTSKRVSTVDALQSSFKVSKPLANKESNNNVSGENDSNFLYIKFKKSDLDSLHHNTETTVDDSTDEYLPSYGLELNDKDHQLEYYLGSLESDSNIMLSLLTDTEADNRYKDDDLMSTDQFESISTMIEGRNENQISKLTDENISSTFILGSNPDSFTCTDNKSFFDASQKLQFSDSTPSVYNTNDTNIIDDDMSNRSHSFDSSDKLNELSDSPTLYPSSSFFPKMNNISTIVTNSTNKTIENVSQVRVNEVEFPESFMFSSTDHTELQQAFSNFPAGSSLQIIENVGNFITLNSMDNEQTACKQQDTNVLRGFSNSEKFTCIEKLNVNHQNGDGHDYLNKFSFAEGEVTKAAGEEKEVLDNREEDDVPLTFTIFPCDQSINNFNPVNFNQFLNDSSKLHVNDITELNESEKYNIKHNVITNSKDLQKHVEPTYMNEQELLKIQNKYLNAPITSKMCPSVNTSQSLSETCPTEKTSEHVTPGQQQVIVFNNCHPMKSLEDKQHVIVQNDIQNFEISQDNATLQNSSTRATSSPLTCADEENNFNWLETLNSPSKLTRSLYSQGTVLKNISDGEITDIATTKE